MIGTDRASHPNYPRSADIDAVTVDSEVTRLERLLGQKRMVEHLTDHHLIRLGDGMGLRENVIDKKSPFTVIRFPDSDIDLFTPSTNLGPISVDASVSRNAIDYTFAGLELKVAHPSYIIATTMNPLVATDQRILRTFLVISDLAAKIGRDALFDDVIKPAVRYMQAGSKNVKEELARIREERRYAYIFKNSCKRYTHYDEYLTSTMPCRLSTEGSKIVAFASNIGVGTKSQNRDLVQDLANFLRKA